MINIKSKLSEYWRIIKISRKPTGKEFKNIMKITGGGLLLIGFMGFLIQIIFSVLSP